MSNLINKRLHTPNWLIALLTIIFLLRIPSFFEPYSYGDEMIYLTLGEAIRQGIPLYSSVHDNKPPFLYLLAAAAGNLFWFKAILAGWHLLTVYVFWKLSAVLFPKKVSAQVVSTIIFGIFTTIPLLEGNIVNSELFMIGPVILAFWILLTKKLKAKTLLLSGGLFSLAALFKIPAAFDMPAILFFWLITEKGFDKKRLFELVRKSLPLVLGFAVPMLLTFIWFYMSGSFREYLIAAFLQNFGYLSSFRPGDIQKPFLVKNGPLLVRGLIVATAILVLYIKRKKLSREFIFSTIWLFFTLFAVALSERPYPHYLIQSVAPISLLFGMFFTGRTKEQVFTIVPLFFAFLVPFYYKFWYYPSAPYYTRFLNLISGKISKAEYLASFGHEVPRNYKIATFIVFSSNPGDKIFVWGDTASIYALTKKLPPIKYVADYHVNDFYSQEEVIKILEKSLPAFIIINPSSTNFPAMRLILERNYGLSETIEGSQIWKLLSPQIRSFISS